MHLKTHRRKQGGQEHRHFGASALAKGDPLCCAQHNGSVSRSAEVRRRAAGAAAEGLEEARAASTLNHPQIAAVYDCGVMNSRPYVAIELVRGPDG
jgi:hypothetical protein